MCVFTLVLATQFGACAQSQACNEQCVGNARRICEPFEDLSEPGTFEECGASRHCVEDYRTYGAYAACAIGGRDMQCNPEGNTVFCEGRRLGAYRTREIDCQAQEIFCATDDRGEGQCVPTDQPDPRCSPDGGPVFSFCDGDIPVRCFGHFVVGRGEACLASQGGCVASERTAGCARPQPGP